jgi:hypothetical protein
MATCRRFAPSISRHRERGPVSVTRRSRLSDAARGNGFGERVIGIAFRDRLPHRAVTPLLLLLLPAAVLLLWWLARVNARDRAALARRLGLHPVPRGVIERAPDPIVGWSMQTAILEGALHGLAVRVWMRTVRRQGRRSPRAKRGFTVLSVEVPASALRFRLEPARTGALAAAFGGDWPRLLLDDPAFDQAFRLSTPTPEAARACFAPELRERWLALRESLIEPIGAQGGDTALGRFAGDLLTGTLVLDRGRLEYAAMGTVSPGVIEHLARAAPEVAALAKRLGAVGAG